MAASARHVESAGGDHADGDDERDAVSGSGRRLPPEGHAFADEQTGVSIRQVTSAPSINHHPFFFVPAYDDHMNWLILVSYRSGTPQIYAEERVSGRLIQLTDQPDIAEWSVYPSHDGRYVYYTAGPHGWRVSTDRQQCEHLVYFGDVAAQVPGMVGAAMGTTALSACDRWWAIKFHEDTGASLAIVDTTSGTWEIVLQRDTLTHMQFCPDDPSLLFYAGPLTDRMWLVDRDGSNNRRLYRRAPGEWITHESWLRGTRELAFVDWPHGVRCLNVDTGTERRLATFNAWHPCSNYQGTAMVADTNFPDIGLQLFDPRSEKQDHQTLCYPNASSQGEHWAGPFPYEHGPITVYAPQHTHPHPSFSPDGRRVVYIGDRSGTAQVYEATIPEEWWPEDAGTG